MFLNDAGTVAIDIAQGLNRKHEMFLNMSCKKILLLIQLNLTVNMKCF